MPDLVSLKGRAVAGALGSPTAAPIDAILTDADLAGIQSARESARAENTRRAYLAQTRNFDRWAKARGYNLTSDDLPLSPTVVAAWIIERCRVGSPWMGGAARSHGASRTTLRVAVAAIKAAHIRVGQRFDAADPLLVEALAGAMRVARNDQRQAEPLTPTMLGEILEGVDVACARDVRDAAMLALLYIFGMRRSELSGLDFAERGDGTGVLKVGAKSIDLTIFRSKGAQNERVDVAVPRERNMRAAAAIERWLAVANITPGSPVLRVLTSHRHDVTPNRLAGDGIRWCVQEAIRRHLVSLGTAEPRAAELARAYGGHSGRVGVVVAAAEAGASDTAIARLTRHKSLEMVKRYAERARQLQTSPHTLAGVGV